jgi:alanine racemase
MQNTFIEINLGNLKRNYLNIRRKIGDKKVLAVVKADAYGHGMIQCANALLELKEKKPDYFGTALLEEGIELRTETGTKIPILNLAPFQIDDISLYQKYDIMPSVSDESQIKQLLKTELKRPLKIHLNVDTGMGITGIPFYKVFEPVKKLALKKKIKIDGIYTIFASADRKNKFFANEQLERFNFILDKLKKAGISYGLVHAANSAAILSLPNAYFDMVRSGSSLYGFYPAKEIEKSYKIYPVMSLYSRVSVIKTLRKGESVGFGRSFVAGKDIKIATVPIGYADGFKRLFSNNFSALIKGKFYSQIGNVSMDRIAFNVGNDKIMPGEKVVFIGKEKNEEITLWDWADRVNSIPYEIACSIGRRIPRKYKS